MRAFLAKIWIDIRGSYWFIPSLMVVAAFFLSLLTTEIDSQVGADWLRDVGWLYFSHTDGARAVLSTIAGSMIGVAGVTFSMTIVSVSFAGAQFGPRLIGNFMRDSGNQITLGTFIATFVYCIFILRTVREAGDAADAVAYVPHVSLLVALALTGASVGVLIFFIHHIPESLNVSNLAAKVGRELMDSIQTVFPEETGEPANETPQSERDFDLIYGAAAGTVAAGRTGYIQTFEQSSVMSVAQKHDLCIRMEFRPGDFAAAGDILMRVWPEGRLNEGVEQELRECFAFGRHRTPAQNLLFLSDELVEVAARALSPGVNDPFTAMECLNWLGAALRLLATRKTPASHRVDKDGNLRVIAQPVTFEVLAEAVFGQLVQYVSADRNAGLYALRTMAMIIVQLKNEAHRQVILRHAQIITAEAQANMGCSVGAAEMEQRLGVIEKLYENPEQFFSLERDLHWLGGSA